MLVVWAVRATLLDQRRKQRQRRALALARRGTRAQHLHQCHTCTVWIARKRKEQALQPRSHALGPRHIFLEVLQRGELGPADQIVNVLTKAVVLVMEVLGEYRL